MSRNIFLFPLLSNVNPVVKFRQFIAKCHVVINLSALPSSFPFCVLNKNFTDLTKFFFYWLDDLFIFNLFLFVFESCILLNLFLVNKKFLFFTAKMGLQLIMFCIFDIKAFYFCSINYFKQRRSSSGFLVRALGFALAGFGFKFFYGIGSAERAFDHNCSCVS